VAKSTIYAADGSIQWTSIKVEGGKTDRAQNGLLKTDPAIKNRLHGTP
jgi:hypothetical protein